MELATTSGSENGTQPGAQLSDNFSKSHKRTAMSDRVKLHIFPKGVPAASRPSLPATAPLRKAATVLRAALQGRARAQATFGDPAPRHMLDLDEDTPEVAMVGRVSGWSASEKATDPSEEITEPGEPK